MRRRDAETQRKTKRFSLRLCVSASFTILALALVPAVAANGPLRRCAANPNYFEDGSGRPVYLTGAHTWDNFQDRGGDPPFDYERYLRLLEKYHHNFMRLWVWEDGGHSPLPFASAGEGKYDLRRFNDAYFERLRARVREAGRRGIYVSVMLFQGFSAGKMKPNAPRPNPWLKHPLNLLNNVNGIDGDPDGDGEGYEEHRLLVPAVTRVQEAYVRKVVDTLNDLDNVLWEIGNETFNERHRDTRDWQYHMIRLIHEYEAGKPKRHPVGMTCQYDWKSGNAELFDSPAEWVSPGPGDKKEYRTDPPLPYGGKVVVPDTDHLWGIGGDPDWVWRSFTRGQNPIYMDPYGGRLEVPASESVRLNLGYTNLYARRLDLARAKPDAAAASSKFCLANPGRQYLVYVPDGGGVSVDLRAARRPLRVEWFNPASGEPTSAGSVEGGGAVEFKAPFAGRAVLFLHAE